MEKSVDAKPKPLRLRHVFWLDLRRDDEADLSDYVAYLKHHRLFIKTIRDGLRLIRDLRNQRTEVLFELFPWIHRWLERRAEAIARTMMEGDDRGHNGGSSTPRSGEARDGSAMKQQLEKWSSVLLDSGDEEIKITKVKADPAQVFQNFMSSLGAISEPAKPAKKTKQPRKAAATGNAKPAKPSGKKQKAAPPEPTGGEQDTKPIIPVPEELPPAGILAAAQQQKPGNPKPLGGATIQFSAPVFDD